MVKEESEGGDTKKKTFELPVYHCLSALMGYTHQKDNPDPTYLALESFDIKDVYDICSMEESDIDELTYSGVDEKGSTAIIKLPLVKHRKNQLKLMRMLLRSLQSDNNGVLTDTMVLNITKDQWNNFRMQVPIGTEINPTSTATAFNPNSEDAMMYNNFMKGIKRSKLEYTILKDMKDFDNWERSFITTAMSHECGDIFNVDYEPPKDGMKLKIYTKLQIFAFTVLEYVLQTEMGRRLVKKHEKTRDAQLCWKEFIADARTSTRAQIVRADILKWLVATRYDPSTWKQTTATSFITTWLEKAQDHDKYCSDSGTGLPDETKLALLKNAVSDVPELRQVATNAETNQAGEGFVLTWVKYISYLQSAAERFDKNLKETGRTKLNKSQNVYQLYMNDDEDDSDDYIESTYDVNVMNRRRTPIQGNKTRNTSNHSSSYKSIGNGTSKLASFPRFPKEMWSRIPPDIKDFILTAIRNERSGASNQNDRNQTANFMDRVDWGDNNHDNDEDGVDDDNGNDNGDDSDALIAHVTKQRSISQAQLARTINKVASQDDKKNSNVSFQEDSINVNGKIYYRKINLIDYIIYKHRTTIAPGYALIDRGANGGVFGNDVRILERTGRFITLTGLNDHQLPDLPICTGAAYGRTHRGPVIFIMHQYALLGRGHTIHSSAQLESFKIEVDDRSVRAPNGTQRLRTPDGYLIPLDIVNGLPYMRMRAPTDDELDSLPHVILTSDVDWDPTCMDHVIADDSNSWYDPGDIPHYPNHAFDFSGNFASNIHQIINIFRTMGEFNVPISVSASKLTPSDVDYEALQPLLGWAPLDIIKATMDVTTQYARSLHLYGNMRKHYKARFPALNVIRRNEPVATDTVYSDVPAIDNGAKCAQIFIGRDSLVADVYGMKTDKEFTTTLEDNIRKRGAMDKLISDRAKSEISKKALDILRAMCIDDWQSEPHNQHQNYAERRYNVIKGKSNMIMNRTGAPPTTWLLCLMYVCFLMNHLAVRSLGWRTPMQVLTGQTSDISPLLQFHFWQEVYYTRIDSKFPSESNEALGNFVGIAEHVGDGMTFMVLTRDTRKVIYTSNVRPATDDKKNLRLHQEHDETENTFIKSSSEDINYDPHISVKPLPGFNPSDLIGRTFLGEEEEDGQRYRLRIVKAIADHFDDIDKNPEKVKFLASAGDGVPDQILTYNEVLEFINRQIEIDNQDHSDGQVLTGFVKILSHQGPLRRDDPNYKGCRWNVEIQWVDGDITFEPINVIGQDDPVTLAAYARRNGLLNTQGWKKYRRFSSIDDKLKRQINATLSNYTNYNVRVKYGFYIPRNHQDAMQTDKKNNNHLWQEAEGLEIKSMDDYKVFIDLGKDGTPPEGYVLIKVHLIYDVKHDGRHKARLVAGGHLTPFPIDSVYSGVVSLRGLRLVIFLAEHNGLELWGADVGNAYLEAHTKEKVYIIAGPEFGSKCGHIMLIDKALYGLRSSGLRWHERFSDILRDLNFVPSRCEPDIWMRHNIEYNVYEYIAVYVDDLAIAAKDPAALMSLLKEKYNLKLKGVGPLKYHLGCDFNRDPDGILAFGPKKYLDKILSSYESKFGEKPKMSSSPLPHGDHPELDTSELLDTQDIQTYQSMIGALQWAISLGRFDIQTAVMTMSQFRVAPRRGHLERLQRIYGYLRRFNDAAIRIRTELLDTQMYPQPENVIDWSYSVYGKVSEVIPDDIPKPLGNEVTLSHYVDANLYHDLITGRAVTGILHFINSTPLEWYSKKQGTVETATYGSEFVAARIATDQIIDLRLTLRYLGVPVIERSRLFCDNNSVVSSSTIPHSGLKKRHLALSYHRVREAIASRIFNMYKVPSKLNYSDVLSKHLGYQQGWPLYRVLLFWKGPLPTDEERLRTLTKGECEDILLSSST